MKSYVWKVLLIALTLFIIFSFVKREVFQYHSYCSYSQLYDPSEAPKWNQLKEAFSAAEMQQAAAELRQNHIGFSGSTLDRSRMIGSYIYQKIGKNPSGQPSAEHTALSTYDGYKLLCADRTQTLWCGTYSRIFALFCLSAGIQCRYIEIIHANDNHVVNEFFAPELHQWVMTDLTFNTLSVKQKNKWLNAIDFRNAVGQSLPLTRYESSALGEKTSVLNDTAWYLNIFFHPAADYYYYHTINLDKVYRPVNKCKRLLLPVSWYDIYSANPKSNFLFYLRMVSVICWVLLVGLIFIKFPVAK